MFDAGIDFDESVDSSNELLERLGTFGGWIISKECA